MLKKREILLGATDDGTILFADLDLRRGYREEEEEDSDRVFSLGFREVSPIEVTDNLLREMVESQIEDYESDILIDLLETYDCKFSELVDYHLDYTLNSYGVEGVIDISLYPEVYYLYNHDDIYFESWSCGQSERRENLKAIDSEFSAWLFDTWDNYHLKDIGIEFANDILERVDDYLDDLGDEEDWIEGWLLENQELIRKE